MMTDAMVIHRDGRIVHQSGGSITMDSHPGGGTNFYLRFPALERQVTAPALLYLSGYSQDALDEGLHFLFKPFSPAVLRQTVRRLLDS